MSSFPNLDLSLKHKNNLKMTNPSPQPPQKKMKHTEQNSSASQKNFLFV